MLASGKLTCWYHPRENFRRAFSLNPTDCPWVSEDGRYKRGHEIQTSRYSDSGETVTLEIFQACLLYHDQSQQRSRHATGHKNTNLLMLLLAV